MHKIFGLFLNNTVLAVMEENVFLSKSKEGLEDICSAILPENIHLDIETFVGCTVSFDIDYMSCTISGDNGMCTIEFKELKVIN